MPRENRYHFLHVATACCRFSPLSLSLERLFADCAQIQPAQCHGRCSIELRGGNLLQQNFAVKLNIQNPNDRALPVRGLHAELNVGGEQIASGISDRAVVIPAFGESEFDLTITANLALGLAQTRRQGQSARGLH